jgi:ATP-dependent Clp protease ATP-binding subunit ClpA
VFERFSDNARQAVVVAQDEARTLRHNYIGSEHILLGLLGQGGTAAGVLASFGVSLDGVRGQVAQLVAVGGQEPSGQIPFTPRAKKVLELSLREAQSLGHSKIGTEHLLLGLLRENEGVGIRVLRDRGIGLREVRSELLRIAPPAPRGDVSLETADLERERMRWAIEEALGALMRAEARVHKYYESRVPEPGKRASPVETHVTVAYEHLKKATEALGDESPPALG